MLPPPREEPPPEERMDELPDECIAPPEERIDELLDERTAELLEVRMLELLERLTEGAEAERVAVDTLDTLFTVEVERVGVETVLPERRGLVASELLREGVLFVRVVTDCERVVVWVTEALRVAAERAPALSTRVALLRVAAVIRSFVRTFVLPKVRDVFPREATRVAPSTERVPAAVRIAVVRLRSISRAF